MLTSHEATTKSSLRKAFEQPDHTNKHGRVLIATEDAETSGAVGGWLTAAGYDVVVVADAAGARKAAGCFDCAVFSLELPDANGVILAADLTAHDKLDSVVFCPDAIRQTDEDDMPAAEEIDKLMEVEAGVMAAMADLHQQRPSAAAA